MTSQVLGLGLVGYGLGLVGHVLDSITDHEVNLSQQSRIEMFWGLAVERDFRRSLLPPTNTECKSRLDKF